MHLLDLGYYCVRAVHNTVLRAEWMCTIHVVLLAVFKCCASRGAHVLNERACINMCACVRAHAHVEVLTCEPWFVGARELMLFFVRCARV